MFAHPTNISGFSGYRATIDCLGAAQGNGAEYTMVFLDLHVLGYQFMGRLHVSNDTGAIAHRLCLGHEITHRKQRVVLAKCVFARAREEHENRRVMKEHVLPVFDMAKRHLEIQHHAFEMLDFLVRQQKRKRLNRR